MKKYTIHFRGRKIRAKQDGPHSEPRVIDEWEETIQSNALPAVWHLTDFVYSRHGIPGAHFCHVPTQHGLFRAVQTEDNKGRFNSKGHYLAQVDVQITVSRNAPTVRVGTFDLPPISQATSYWD